MSILSRLLFKSNKKRKNAAAPAGPATLAGKPLVGQSRYDYIDREIDASIIAADREIPTVISSLVGLSRLCLLGFDWQLDPIDEGDDTQGPQIDAALKQIKSLDRKLGRVGMARNVGTLGLVRAAALEGWTWRRSFFEFKMQKDGSWINPIEIQNLPSHSFAAGPTMAWDQNRYIQDTILKGVIYDIAEDRPRFYQSQNTLGEPVEIDAANLLHIEDLGLPPGVSLVKALVPSIEQWKELRRDAMLTMHGVGVPRETARIDIEALAKAKDAGLAINIDDLKAHAQDLVENQSTEQAQVAMPGMLLEYPDIKIAVNPWEADAYLKKEIIDFFFHRDVLEVTAQAISATNAPAKDLLDIHIASEREIVGRPFELFWTNWLEINGFDLTLTFAWWNWAPKDQEAERKGLVDDLVNGAIDINEYRAKRGYDHLEDDEVAKLIDQHLELKGLGLIKQPLSSPANQLPPARKVTLPPIPGA